MRADRERLEDILASIARIEASEPESLEALRADPLRQDVVIYRLQIIGEAVGRLSLTLKARHQSVLWNRIAGMRNRTVHAYHEVDLGIVWQVINEELPGLRTAVETMLKEIG